MWGNEKVKIKNEKLGKRKEKEKTATPSPYPPPSRGRGEEEEEEEKKEEYYLCGFVPGVSPPAKDFRRFAAWRRWVAGREAAGTRSVARGRSN